MGINYKVVIPAIITVILFILVVAGYFYYQSQKHQVKSIPPVSPKVISQQGVSDLVAEVGKLMVLPTGETPTIATITDITKLKSQSFFLQAKNGDKVLIYVKAAKAYLYSVSQNKILEVAPVTVNQNPAQVAGVKTEPSPTPAPRK